MILNRLLLLLINKTKLTGRTQMHELLGSTMCGVLKSQQWPLKERAKLNVKKFRH